MRYMRPHNSPSIRDEESGRNQTNIHQAVAAGDHTESRKTLLLIDESNSTSTKAPRMSIPCPPLGGSIASLKQAYCCWCYPALAATSMSQCCNSPLLKSLHSCRWAEWSGFTQRSRKQCYQSCSVHPTLNQSLCYTDLQIVLLVYR